MNNQEFIDQLSDYMIRHYDVTIVMEVDPISEDDDDEGIYREYSLEAKWKEEQYYNWYNFKDLGDEETFKDNAYKFVKDVIDEWKLYDKLYDCTGNKEGLG